MSTCPGRGAPGAVGIGRATGGTGLPGPIGAWLTRPGFMPAGGAPGAAGAAVVVALGATGSVTTGASVRDAPALCVIGVAGTALGGGVAGMVGATGLGAIGSPAIGGRTAPGIGGRIGPEASGGRSPIRGAGFSSSGGATGAAASTGFSSCAFAAIVCGPSGTRPVAFSAFCVRRGSSACSRSSRPPLLVSPSWCASCAEPLLGGSASPRNTWRSCRTTSSSTELE